jgi:transposase
MEGPTGFLPQEHNRAYSKETKLSAVLDYLAGKGSMREICEEYGVLDSRQLRNWLKVYNRHEDFKIHTGGSRMTKGRDTTAQERIQIVKACIANGNDYGGTALKYRVSYQQVYTWTKKYHAMGEAGLEDRRGHRAGTLPSRTPEEYLRDRIAQLEREKYDLEMENALLKKVKELERRRR